MSTTASFTHCWKNAPVDRTGLRRGLRGFVVWVLLALALCGLHPGVARADNANAEITQLRLERADDGVYLEAAIQFTLPPLVESVLDKGIAVFFVAEAEVYRDRWWWTDRKVAQAARHMRLAYQPLTRRWRLNVSPQPITNAGIGAQLNQYFDSLDDALDAVKRIGRLRLGAVDEIGEEGTPTVVFRFQLDTSQLPRPFQIGAVGHDDWNIAAERSVRLSMEKSK